MTLKERKIITKVLAKVVGLIIAMYENQPVK